MLGHNRLRYAETDDNHAARKETDDHYFVSFETLKAEERNLGVQQPATHKRQTDQHPRHPIVR